MQKLRNRSSGTSDIRFSRLLTTLEACLAGNTVKGRLDIRGGTLEPNLALNNFSDHDRMGYYSRLFIPLPTV